MVTNILLMFNTLTSMGKTIKEKKEKKPRKAITKHQAEKIQKEAEMIDVVSVMFEGAEVLEVLNQINATTYACQMSDGTTKAVPAHLLKGLIDEEESEM